MKTVRNAYKILVGKSERDNSEELDVSGEITLEWILEKWSGKVWN
jgi:hypothetical protein